MGYLKHIFGDDMTPEERARLDHAELIETIQNHGACLTARALKIHHDRFYGDSKECAWCLEPQRQSDAKKFECVQAAFERPASKPEKTQPKARPPVNARAFGIMLDETLFRQIVESQRRIVESQISDSFTIVERNPEPKDEKKP